jgi:hypothetical protein
MFVGWLGEGQIRFVSDIKLQRIRILKIKISTTTEDQLHWRSIFSTEKF